MGRRRRRLASSDEDESSDDVVSDAETLELSSPVAAGPPAAAAPSQAQQQHLGYFGGGYASQAATQAYPMDEGADGSDGIDAGDACYHAAAAAAAGWAAAAAAASPFAAPTAGAAVAPSRLVSPLAVPPTPEACLGGTAATNTATATSAAAATEPILITSSPESSPPVHRRQTSAAAAAAAAAGAAAANLDWEDIQLQSQAMSAFLTRPDKLSPPSAFRTAADIHREQSQAEAPPPAAAAATAMVDAADGDDAPEPAPAAKPPSQEQLLRMQENKRRALERRRQAEQRRLEEATAKARQSMISSGQFTGNIKRERPHPSSAAASSAAFFNMAASAPAPAPATPTGAAQPPNDAQRLPSLSPRMSSEQLQRAIDSALPAAAPPPPPALSPEQHLAIDYVRRGENIFITGSAGVGKSFVMREVINALRSAGKEVAVTASTGVAAVNISGCTLHSWGGIGLGDETKMVLVDKVRRSKPRMRQPIRRDAHQQHPPPKQMDKAWCRWYFTDVLIIDEISMIPSELFNKLDYIGRQIRGSKLPFGGLQLVCCGDFFQLPPVTDKNMCCPTCGLKGACKRLSPTECICEPTRKGCGQTYDNSTKFAFQPDSLGNNAWASSNFHVFELTKVFRQDNRTFVDHLNKIRLGTCDEDTEAFINTAARPLQLAAADIKPTKLYPLNRNVDYENNQHYNALNTEAITFSAFDGHGGPNGAKLLPRMQRDCQAKASIELKVEAQVMLLFNLDLARGLCNGSRGVIVGYVDSTSYTNNLSRSGNEVPHASKLRYWCMKNPRLPVVLFANDVTMVIPPVCWEMTMDESVAFRTQIPLKLAWAVTVHKSQGLSLDLVEMDLTQTFDCGMAYVALSRARSMAGLEVRGFTRDKVKADPAVIDFYKDFQEQQEKRMQFESERRQREKQLEFEREQEREQQREQQREQERQRQLALEKKTAAVMKQSKLPWTSATATTTTTAAAVSAAAASAASAPAAALSPSRLSHQTAAMSGSAAQSMWEVHQDMAINLFLSTGLDSMLFHQRAVERMNNVKQRGVALVPAQAPAPAQASAAPKSAAAASPMGATAASPNRRHRRRGGRKSGGKGQKRGSAAAPAAPPAEATAGEAKVDGEAQPPAKRSRRMSKRVSDPEADTAAASTAAHPRHSSTSKNEAKASATPSRSSRGRARKGSKKK